MVTQASRRRRPGLMQLPVRAGTGTTSPLLPIDGSFVHCGSRGWRSRRSARRGRQRTRSPAGGPLRNQECRSPGRVLRLSDTEAPHDMPRAARKKTAAITPSTRPKHKTTRRPSYRRGPSSTWPASSPPPLPGEVTPGDGGAVRPGRCRRARSDPSRSRPEGRERRLPIRQGSSFGLPVGAARLAGVHCYGV